MKGKNSMKQGKSTAEKNLSQKATYIVMTVKEVTEYTKSTSIAIDVEAFKTLGDIFKFTPLSTPQKLTARKHSSNEEIQYDCTNYKMLISSLNESNIADYSLIKQNGFTGNSATCTTEYTFCVQEIKVPTQRNKAKLLVLEIYNRKTAEVVINKAFVGFKELDKLAYEYYQSDYEGRKYDYYINGFNMNGYFNYLTRDAYKVSYWPSYDTSASIRITIDKTYKSVIPKLGLVSSKKDEHSEFTCCFCERTFSGKRNKHSVGAIRPKTNAEGIPNYCCTCCFKKYVVPMIAYVNKLNFVRGFPGYEDVPSDINEIFPSIQKMSLREMQDIIKREHIDELVLPTLQMLAAEEEKRGK